MFKFGGSLRACDFLNAPSSSLAYVGRLCRASAFACCLMITGVLFVCYKMTEFLKPIVEFYDYLCSDVGKKYVDIV